VKEVTKLLLAVVVGAGIALGATAVANDDDDGISTQTRVIAEARFQQAELAIHETYRRLLERELPGVEVPSIEGPEPCVGIGDEGLRELCSDALAISR